MRKHKMIFSKQFFKISLVFLPCLVLTQTLAQSTMGGWTLHVPAREASSVVAHGNMIYAAFDNGVLEYDRIAKEKSVLTSTNSLSDVSVSTLGYEPNSGTVVIGYKNGNIDLLNDNTIFNLPAIKLAQIQGIKEVFKIKSYLGKIYVATGFGVVILDPSKQEVRDTYYPTENKEIIYDLEFSGDTVFVLTDNRMLWGLRNNPGLGDFNQWTIDTRVPFNASNPYRGLQKVNNEMILQKNDASYSNDSVFRITSAGLLPINIGGFNLEIRSISAHNNQLAVNVDGGVFVMNSDYSAIDYSRNSYSLGEFPIVKNSIRLDDRIFLADRFAGLVELDLSTGGFEKISFQGPPSNNFYGLDWEAGKLICTGGGLSGSFFTFNNSGFYLLNDQEWSLYSKSTVSAWDTLNVFDFITASINPKNPNEFAFGTYSGIPVGIINQDKSGIEMFSSSNSPLENTVLGNGWSYASDVQYDEEGNLWVVNSYCNSTLKVLKPNKEWVSIDMGGNSKNGFSGKMAIDYNNNIWFAVEGKGMFALNYGGTLDNLADDKKVFFQKGEGLGDLPSNSVRSIAVDFDNEIWIGTDAGFAIVYNSESVFDAAPGDFDAQRIKLDFEGNVEYLLGGTVINDIEVDGGNRKWLGTDGTGIFLMSPDGLTILANYTKENSPLISNIVLDMEIDHNTGEIYCVTDQGLISFRTDATYEDPEYEDVQVFPNPARPDFGGVITIQGIRYNSDVKITDMGGNLVYQTTSNGGTAIWNGKNLDGTKVASGVYLIWTAANEGKGRKVGKVVVINE
jgi:Two component regulator propeller